MTKGLDLQHKSEAALTPCKEEEGGSSSVPPTADLPRTEVARGTAAVGPGCSFLDRWLPLRSVPKIETAWLCNRLSAPARTGKCTFERC